MDSSSPLAAMHPTAPIWGPTKHSHFAQGNPFSTSSLNMREQMQRAAKPDYFNVKSVRGSSPSSSLAADMSQNFRLDNEVSPRFPTPRRALFTNSIMGTLENRDYITTPPSTDSSPAQLSDAMDISPMPQKRSFISTKIEVTSPTPSPMDEEMMMMEDSPIPVARKSSASLELPRPGNDRKRVGIRRPSLTRMKGYSTSALVHRLHPESQLASFRFGSETQFTSNAAEMSAGDCFIDSSPASERRPQTANSPSPTSASRPKPQFASLTGTRDIRNGSPLSAHVRRQSNPFNRPRRQYRRSLSMFDSPSDVSKVKAEGPMAPSTLQSVTDVDEPDLPSLPHFFPEGESDCIPRISRDTFLDVLDGKYSAQFDHKTVIDCRFEYEYEGGHIDGAINYNDKELLATQLFQQPMDGKILLIFHCEYSAHRAPMMARHIRARDRTVNAEFYPRLTYPEIYILEGGYSEFFNQHPARCYPQAYVEMGAAEHAFTCERELGKLQQKRKGLSRAATFAFGHRESMVDDSPTAPGRPPMEHPSPDMIGTSPDMIGNSPILGHYRSPARRMASY
ncbi:M-phase inducer phosphatase [Xylariomycetidae sp. FL2044]|nr:M-phase inducer phosphatase [Xylariomycetidae sp. FL2044]